MRYYIVRRLLLFIPVLFGLSIITFTVSHIVPGDPVGLAAGPGATPQEIEQLQHDYGTDKPLPEQYLTYMSNLLHGDMGRSMTSRHKVLDDLASFFPATLELVLVSMVLAIAVGIPLGMVSAVYRDRWPDQFSRIFALSSISFPRFWLAIVLQLIFAMTLGWMPVGGRFDVRQTLPRTVTGLLLVDSLLAGSLTDFLTAAKHIIMPAICQSLTVIAFTTRLLRSDVLETLQKDFVRMARSSGIPERVILFKYVLKNSMIATISTLGFLFGFALGGTVLIESVFDWPGIGLYALKSAVTLDFQPIMGITLFVGLLFSIVNLATDVVYGMVDPRIRYG
ncbi:MAG: ABC transporter permease [Chloroflexi bacterium]|nr:ABC transporter permease [Chloroflexota bacterium]